MLVSPLLAMSVFDCCAAAVINTARVMALDYGKYGRVDVQGYLTAVCFSAIGLCARR